MKLTKSKLKQIIKEELTKIVEEEDWAAGWHERDEDWFEKGVMGRKIATARWYPDENKWKWDITTYHAAGPEDYYEEPAAGGEADTEERAKQLAHAAYKTA